MLRKCYLAVAMFCVLGINAYSQNTGSISGRVLDKSTGEPLPFANVIAEINGRQAGGAQTDMDGKYTIKPLSPGNYNVKASFVGYTAFEVKDILVSADKITYQDLKLGKGAVDIQAVEISTYKQPIIDKGQTSTQQTITTEQIQQAPTRSVTAIAATSAGIVQTDENKAINVRGSRSDATDFIVDGIRVRGALRLPQSAVEQITVKTGGLEAQYGDNTGGVIVVSTRGPAEEISGGIEVVTSELFDDYGYNLIGANVSGPIFSKKTESGKRPIAGFFLSAEYQKDKDRDPSAVGTWQLKEGVLDELKKDPLKLNSIGSALEPRAVSITANDVEKINYKNNNNSKAFRINGKIDIAPTKNMNVTIGGSYDKLDVNLFSLNYMLFNTSNNENRVESNTNAFIRFTHKLSNSDEKSSSLLKNAYYTLQFDLSQFTQNRQNKDFKDNYFDYGYIGKFTQQQRPVYLTGDTIYYDPLDSNNYTTVTQAGISYYNYTFTPGNVNPESQAYTQAYYDYANSIGILPKTSSDVINNNALINGSAPGLIFGLWIPFGNVFNLYTNLEQNQYTGKFAFSTDIKNHNIMLGFEYEQRVERYFAVSPRSLWGKMRQLANSNLLLNSGTYTYGPDTAYWQPSYLNTSGIPGFYENVRKQLGLGITDYVDLDSYDRDNFSLSLFTPDELFNNGSTLISYYGFDYTGKKLSGKPSYESFFKRGSNGKPAERAVDAFRPNYMAFYVQDKFDINDLIFNIGVRVDRFDANQKVLTDPYTLYPTKTVGQLNIPNRPDNIGDDFVPYVVDISNPSVNEIIGYRDGNTWYDASGAVVTDPSLLAQINSTTVIYPYLEDTRLAMPRAIEGEFFDANRSFKDYEPQITVMPRVAFSFPISDEAQFFAHYDVLTQRPSGRLRNDPLSYLYWEIDQGPLFSNPSLKPERTVDYELGFKQALTKSSALSISAFYRELKDMIQLIQLPFAYPKTYQTYGNFDFGTVKGVILSYDLRRVGNIRLNLNYTLQFAEGTGSNDQVSTKLLANGLPNLRTLTPLDFDQRHVLVASVDYRYSSGKDYNGPMLFGKQIFANAGANLVFRLNSGTPYTANSDISNQIANLGVQQEGVGAVKGSINGSRLPWQTRIDLRLDKEFAIKLKGEGSRELGINVYLQVQNLLNAKNILGVYAATGVPDDDGYLASALGQQSLNQLPVEQQQAFIDQYWMKAANPNFYSLPRRMRLGLEINF
ncbi:MAG: TonB-dependent receptor [Bacteroidia bacterium]|nr:TonB-dependent receptor [Bacteroidia bacterium]